MMELFYLGVVIVGAYALLIHPAQVKERITCRLCDTFDKILSNQTLTENQKQALMKGLLEGVAVATGANDPEELEKKGKENGTERHDSDDAKR